MAQYQGFTCDSCGNVMTAEERTKVTVRYEGEIVQGEYVVDKCKECVAVPEGITLKPLRRRKPQSGHQTSSGETLQSVR